MPSGGEDGYLSQLVALGRAISKVGGLCKSAGLVMGDSRPHEQGRNWGWKEGQYNILHKCTLVMKCKMRKEN